jgi:hypothetical protein
VHKTGVIKKYYSITTNSTRLFIARPSEVEFDAIGLELPYPFEPVKFFV